MIRKLGTILLVLVLLLSVGAYTVAAGSPPVADANGPYSGFVGQPTQLDGSGSSDPDGDIVLYEEHTITAAQLIRSLHIHI
jgi:hypothetical protein